jgi:hypothetical protein
MKRICIVLGIILCLIILILAGAGMLPFFADNTQADMQPAVVAVATNNSILGIEIRSVPQTNNFDSYMVGLIAMGTVVALGFILLHRKTLINLLGTFRTKIANGFRGALAGGTQLKFPIAA